MGIFGVIIGLCDEFELALGFGNGCVVLAGVIIDGVGVGLDVRTGVEELLGAAESV